MSFQEDLPLLASENLFDFLLKDDIPCPEGPGAKNELREDCSLADSEVLDEDMDGLITSVLLPLKDELDILDDYLLEKGYSSISENQHLSHSPGSNFAEVPQNSDTVQADHNCSLYLDVPVLESMRPDMAEGGTLVGLEGTSMPLEQSSTFPIAVGMDVGPQLEPGDIMQAEEQLLKELHQQQSTQDSHHENMNAHSLENRLLLVQLDGRQTLVSQSTTVTNTAENSTMVTVVSLNFTLSPYLLFQSGELETAVIEDLQHACPTQAAPDVQNIVLEGCSPEPEDLLLLINLSPAMEEEPSPPDPDGSDSCYYLLVEDSDEGPSQPQEQMFPE